MRLSGHVCRYVPKAVVHHYAYKYPGELKPLQLYHSLRNAVYLRFKYGRLMDVIRGFFLLFLGLIRGNFGRWNAVRVLAACPLFFVRSLRFRWRHRSAFNGKRFEFHGLDFACRRKGAFHPHPTHRPRGPLVTVIIRTMDRPEALREALTSVVHQTYEPIDIIVVQDGRFNADNAAVISAFRDRRIRYIPSGKKVGRCRAGNIGLENAAGDYINFLDDDDLFFADHLETLVSAVLEHRADAAHALSFVTPQVITRKPYTYRITDILHGIDVSHNPHSLLYFNQFPIQCVLFSRHLYEKHGGLDENLDYLEDWDLWLRYSQTWQARRVGKTTSIFRVPGDSLEARAREQRLEAYHTVLHEKYADREFAVTGRELIEMSAHLFGIFPMKLMRHDIDNMDASLLRHCLYLSENDPMFNNSLKVVLMRAFGTIYRKHRSNRH
jgi:glycosyltransferase involved in cell wall biosynthesis